MNYRFMKLVVMFVFVGCLLSAFHVFAAPDIINYQGVLTDQAGSPLSGDYDISFYLFDDEFAGKDYWSETQRITVEQGLYNVQLGSVASLEKIDLSRDYWLEVVVDGEILSPRQQLTSVPYALRAANAETLDGIDSTAFQRVEDGNVVVSGTLEVNNEISINGTTVVNSSGQIIAARAPFSGSQLVSESQGQQINSWVGFPHQEWALCYRYSSDTQTSTAFHYQCNNRGPTVTIVKMETDGVENSERLIGAYNPNAYTDSVGYEPATYHFLFSLTNNYKHRAFNHLDNGLYSNPSYGPTFGAGHDFTLDGTMSAGYCNLGYTYVCRAGSYGSDTCRNDFCGSYNAWSVEELEIWYAR